MESTDDKPVCTKDCFDGCREKPEGGEVNERKERSIPRVRPLRFRRLRRCAQECLVEGGRQASRQVFRGQECAVH